MKTIGIIAEYDPFHRGHQYQIRQAREKAGADYVIVVMSPDFVQRGGVAFLDKWTRAHMALLGGADLVLELPVCYAVSSAEYFAEGGVALLSSLGVVDYLSFGCEAERPELLEEAAGFFALPEESEPEEYKNMLRENMKSGMTYPAARASAYLKYLQNGPASSGSLRDLKDALSRPNNILAVEYLKAMKRFGSSMSPLAVRRVGQDYHGTQDAGGGFASAEYIRNVIREGACSSLPDLVSSECLPTLPDLIPSECLSPLLDSVEGNAVLFDQDLDPLLQFRLTELACQEKLALSPSELPLYLDVTPDLANRISRHLNEYGSFDQFVSLIKTRQITETRIRRALIHVLLDIRTDEVKQFRRSGTAGPGVPGPAHYARILGFRKSAGPLLHRIRENSSVPLVSSLPDALRIPESGGEPFLSRNARTMLLQTVYSSRLRDLALQNKKKRQKPWTDPGSYCESEKDRQPVSEYRRRPVMI